MPLIRSFQKKNDVMIFDEAMMSSTYDARHLQSFMEVEEKHFWFKQRRDRICKMIQAHVSKSERILDIGGGTGFIASKIQQLGFSIEVGDIYSTAFHLAKQRGIEQLYQFDLFNPPFEEEFDVICLFDVLEHFPDPGQAIEGIKKMLKLNGKLIVTVPAHKWLWSREDKIAGHQCRYSKAQLRELVRSLGFQLTETRYFFWSILPLLILRKWLKRDDGSNLKPDEIFETKAFPVINGFLNTLVKLEFYLDRFLPNCMGGSLIAVAVKRDKIQ